MYLLFKNNQYNLALNYSFIKEIIKSTDIVPLKENPNLAGVINYRGQIVPISLQAGFRPTNAGVFIIIQNAQGLGGLWVEEVETVVNNNFQVKPIEFNQSNYEILETKKKLYFVVNGEEIFAQQAEKISA